MSDKSKIRVVDYSIEELTARRSELYKDLEFEYNRNPEGSFYSERLEDELAEVKFLMGEDS